MGFAVLTWQNSKDAEDRMFSFGTLGLENSINRFFVLLMGDGEPCEV